ncbi:hypothetical protein F5B19DRAFT_124933 [Rostrohypoxylon terebratum]|nr:hypothetical protein F5B19DRAFT_124933 [Rostrohypoxylon terebratum]
MVLICMAYAVCTSILVAGMVEHSPETESRNNYSRNGSGRKRQGYSVDSVGGSLLRPIFSDLEPGLLAGESFPGFLDGTHFGASELVRSP